MENNKQALFTNLTTEEAADINGGNLGGYDWQSNWYAPIVATLDPSIIAAHQYDYISYYNYLNTAFLQGGSMYDGLNAIQSLVNWAGSPIV
ncbi:hypothetical protein [Gloeocapsopsis sp. IPPAS B-1203]|uniref:hypothetical protein n=1 Tax=Gloeocapsopsis sp. IPPAS B-1203 TaxID=2049454 RepID=UPI000C19C2BE|nr:hypothetical protein [Gloeocapsopsis sp. IPPAS B-1203]PIG91701.1 hypothetical protein CSQ79_19355 [Gloeocapsopsis sp. IPPAS B-1203]